MSYLKIKKTNLKKEKTVSSTKRLVSTARKDASVQYEKKRTLGGTTWLSSWMTHDETTHDDATDTEHLELCTPHD